MWWFGRGRGEEYKFVPVGESRGVTIFESVDEIEKLEGPFNRAVLKSASRRRRRRERKRLGGFWRWLAVGALWWGHERVKVWLCKLDPEIRKRGGL